MILMGSYYWNINDEKSDKDYIDYIMPTREDLIDGNITSKSAINKDGDDYNIKDIRMLINELAKGSLILFQILFNEDLVENKYANKCIEIARAKKEELFVELKPSLMRSIYGEMQGTANNIRKLENKAENMPLDEDETRKLYKHKANIVKLGLILKMLYDGENPFIKWFESDDYASKVKLVKAGESTVNVSKHIEYASSLKLPNKKPINECRILLSVKERVTELIFENLR